MKTLKGHNFAEYFKYYVSLVKEENIEKSLKDSYGLIKSTIENLDEEKGIYAYGKDKWSIKELLVHIIDTERIFCERALRFARNDKTELPGFDHDEYVKFSNANNRTLKSILKEYKAQRKSTIQLFKNFNDEMLKKSGKANGNELTVLTIAYIISGHELHHLEILKTKYLV